MSTQIDPVAIGKLNRLEVLKQTDFGLYLDGDWLGEVLLPQKYVPADCEVGDWIDVFLYLDSQDRIIATTLIPYAQVDEFAYLQVIEVNDTGAFLDWGLEKDLLVPYAQQKQKMVKGNFYAVYVYLDESSQRLVGSSKVYKFMDQKKIPYTGGEKVTLTICTPFDIGYMVIIDRCFIGAIYKNEIFQPLNEGAEVVGYIRRIRPDGKIDAALQRPGDHQKKELTEVILDQLKEGGGFLPLGDSSEPEAIYEAFQVSKKVYKRALGLLYKQRLIAFENDGIRLVRGH